MHIRSLSGYTGAITSLNPGNVFGMRNDQRLALVHGSICLRFLKKLNRMVICSYDGAFLDLGDVFGRESGEQRNSDRPVSIVFSPR